MIAIDDILAKGVALNDHLPVNIYKGNTKVAGWHPQTVIGEGTISLDGAYNVPPDALVIDGKCVQTGTPSPIYPAPITTITGDLTITAANGDLSDTVVTPLGSVELCSLPDGTKDTYDAVTGVVTRRVGRTVLNGSEYGWGSNATATTGYFRRRIDLAAVLPQSPRTVVFNGYCDRFVAATYNNVYDRVSNTITVNDTMSRLYFYHDATAQLAISDFKTWLAANPVTVYYKLAEPYTIQLTPDLPVVRTGIKTLSVSANITPSFTATVKAMD